MTVLLGDVVEVVMGQAPPGHACNKVGDGVPFVKAGEFAERRPVIREWTTKPLRMAQQDDTLVCVVGATAGKVNQGADCAIGRSVAAVRPWPQSIDSSFLYRFLSTTVSRLRAGSQGAAQGVITREMICNLELDLPSLDEQRRIAVILDRADALRAKRREVLARLDSLGTSIASEALSTGLPGSSDAVLGDIADVITGFAFPSAKFVGEGIRLCRGANVLPGRIDWSDLRCWPSEERGGLDRFALSEGDIVLALDRPWIAEGQKMARVSKGDLPSLLVQRVARIRASSEELQGLIWASLSSPSFQRHCRPTETTIPHISPVELRNYPIFVPSPPTLSRLHATTSALETQRSAATRQLAEMQELFASLESRAFRGEL